MSHNKDENLQDENSRDLVSKEQNNEMVEVNEIPDCLGNDPIEDQNQMTDKEHPIMESSEPNFVTEKIEPEDLIAENKEVESDFSQKAPPDEVKVYVSDHDVKKIKRKRIIIGVSLVIFFCIIFVCGIACLNKINPNVYKNVVVLGMDFSGKTEEEVRNMLTTFVTANLTVKEETSEAKVPSKNKIDVYQDTESIYSILPTDFGFTVDIEKTTASIMQFGRNQNILRNNIEIIKAFFKNRELEPIYTYDSEKLDGILKNVDLTIKNRVVDDKYSVDEATKKLLVTRGTKGNSINYEVEKQKIMDAAKMSIQNVGTAENTNILKLDILEKVPAQLDLQKVYAEVKRDARDAYIDKTTNPIKLVNEVVGFDMNVEELKLLLEKDENKVDGKVIEFNLTVIQPKVKLSDISYMLYKDKIAGSTTYFPAGQANRANNIEIALRDLNGKIIMPGETFSYNKAIGDTTVAKGYKPAGTFKGGTVVDELGGGICQTTSTLYDVALMANLQIVERHQHGLPVGYVPPSLDATVYSPMLDFKFKNTRKYPVKIVTSFSKAGNMNISIYGTKEEQEYEISLSHKYISTIAFGTKYIYDDTMPDGQQVVVSNGVNGYTSEGYITKKLNGAIVSTNLLSKDTYNAQQQIIKIGTKK